MQKKKALVWFTNNLRIIDNTSLLNAVETSDEVVGYYNFQSNNFDKDKWGFRRTEGFRLKFLLESLENLKEGLLKLNISLIIDFSPDMEGLVKWINKLGISSKLVDRRKAPNLTIRSLSGNKTPLVSLLSFIVRNLYNLNI